MTKDEMVGWHLQLDGHELGQTPGDSEGQGSLACCSPRGRKVLAVTDLQQRVGHDLVTERHKYTEGSSCEARPSCTRETALGGFSSLAVVDAAEDALGSSLDAG